MKAFVAIVILFTTCVVHAGNLNREDIKGLYHLSVPERGKSTVQIDFGQMGNKVVLAVACEGCPPATYGFLKEESSTLQVATFMTAGLYVFQYDDESFIVVQPDSMLGRKIWTKIGHANIYSKNPNKAKSVSRADIETFALSLSSKIMNQEVGKMSHAGGTYYLAVPMTHLGKAISEYQINFSVDSKKKITIRTCDKCGEDEYEHLPEESAIAGVDVYRHSSSHYLFDLKDGVLLYTFANASGLGKNLWGKHSNYNVFSNNKAYIRQILASKEKQNTIDTLMADYFASIKTAVDERAEEERQAKVARQELPSQGMTDKTQQEQGLAAAKRWASAWAWKETLKAAYYTSADWSITRNPLTGVITGKVARGYITMTHPDGRCRFQYTSFRQDYDGASYMNLHMTGVGPIYDIPCGKI